MKSVRQPTSLRGATVLEMVVVLAIIILFAGIVAPEVRNYFEEAKAAKVIAIYNEMAEASMKYWADTGYYAIETSTRETQDSHQLFYKPTPHLPGWSGAYINHPLSKGDNPFRRDVFLYNSKTVAGLPNSFGFDLDFDGSNEVKSDEMNFLVFDLPADMQITEPVLLKIDKAIDGVRTNWAQTGRVQIIGNAPPYRIAIFVFTKAKQNP